MGLDLERDIKVRGVEEATGKRREEALKARTKRDRRFDWPRRRHAAP